MSLRSPSSLAMSDVEVREGSVPLPELGRGVVFGAGSDADGAAERSRGWAARRELQEVPRLRGPRLPRSGLCPVRPALVSPEGGVRPRPP